MGYQNQSIRKKLVLIVDDDEGIREAVSELLAYRTDVITTQAATGAEAITLVGSLRPDVILLDMRLQDMSGVQVTREILARQPQAHIFLCSGFCAEQRVAEGLRAGARGYLQKDTLVDRLPELIHEAAAHRFDF